MNEQALTWIPTPLLVAGEPRSWGAGAHPWTLTITFDGARYTVRASDDSAELPTYLGLGSFATLDAARIACLAFLHDQQFS